MSENTPPKRRLKLMPEVLPTPRPPGPALGPRERTLHHLQRLMALAAAGAALQGSSCSKTGPGADGAPKASGGADSPSSAAPAGGEPGKGGEGNAPDAKAPASAEAVASATPQGAGGASATAPPSASAAASAKPPIRRPKPPGGYRVVDPMPMPARERKDKGGT